MSAQSTYDETPAIAQVGQIAEQFSQRQVDSGVAEGAITLGDAVSRGTNAGQYQQLTGAATNVRGVMIGSTGADQAVPAAGATLAAADEDPVSVMVRGRVWVKAGGAVVIDAEVTPGLDASAGEWSSGANLLSDVRAFARTAAGAQGDLLMIELVGPQGAVA